jgi:hypothetical protein
MEEAMFKRMGAAVVGLLQSALVVVVLVVLLIALVGWAKTNPAQAQAALTKVITTGVAVLTWVCNEIQAALA